VAAGSLAALVDREGLADVPQRQRLSIGAQNGPPFRFANSWERPLSERNAINASDKEAVMVAIPTEYLDLLQQKATSANLATIMVSFDYTNGKIRINSARVV
jgi:hypothetical protein